MTHQLYHVFWSLLQIDSSSKIQWTFIIFLVLRLQGPHKNYISCNANIFWTFLQRPTWLMLSLSPHCHRHHRNSYWPVAHLLMMLLNIDRSWVVYNILLSQDPTLSMPSTISHSSCIDLPQITGGKMGPPILCGYSNLWHFTSCQLSSHASSIL